MSGDFCSSQIWAGDGAASDLWWVGARAAAQILQGKGRPHKERSGSRMTAVLRLRNLTYQSTDPLLYVPPTATPTEGLAWPLVAPRPPPHTSVDNGSGRLHLLL